MARRRAWRVSYSSGRLAALTPGHASRRSSISLQTHGFFAELPPALLAAHSQSKT
ncbi:MAG: hypothetical protein JO061_22105 [Acidobacteriaceae bacterium]|nr:hypothetical protein [Acidobacteriaceae bacterium]